MFSSVRWPAWASASVAALLLLAGCASGPSGGPRPGRDGPPAVVPEGLAEIADAQPRVEPIRAGGPNKPYEVMGVRYQPFTDDRAWVERGLASWYGRKFHGRSTASGEIYDMFAMTAAHPTMPLPSYAKVRNPANGREVIVRVNDRGPFHRGRIIDLSYAAALKLDLLKGVAPVEIQRLTAAAIREGRGRDGAGDTPASTIAPGLPADDAGKGNTTPPIQAEPTLATLDDNLAEPAAVLARQAPGFWLQLGAYRQREGAEGFQRRVAAEFDWLAEHLAVFADEALFRLQAGPYPSRDQALVAAERIRQSLHLVPLMQERR